MASTSDYGETFVPKDTIPITVGKTTLYVYPNISLSMSNTEKSYGFMVTQSALEVADDITTKTKLQVFGGSTDTAPLIGIIQSRFIDHANRFIHTSGSFSVVSYLNCNGIIMTKATIGDGSILKPTDNQTNASHRPHDIRFAKLDTNITFTDIDPSLTGATPFSLLFVFRMKPKHLLTLLVTRLICEHSTAMTTGQLSHRTLLTTSSTIQPQWGSPSISSHHLSLTSTPTRLSHPEPKPLKRLL
jgi:hypothetical protein